MPETENAFPVVSGIGQDPLVTCKLPILRGFSEIKRIFDIATQHKAVIAGGYAHFCATPRPFVYDNLVYAGQVPSSIAPSDIDVFAIDAAAVVADFAKAGFSPGRESAFSITLDPVTPDKDMLKLASGPAWARLGASRMKIQVVKFGEIYASAAEDRWDVMLGVQTPQAESLEDMARKVLASFDFSIVKVAILDSDTIIADHRFWDHELENKFVVDCFKSGPYLCQRLAKYRRRGYDFDADAVIAFYERSAITEAQKSTISRIRWGIREAHNRPQKVLDKGVGDSGGGIVPDVTDLSFE